MRSPSNTRTGKMSPIVDAHGSIATHDVSWGCWYAFSAHQKMPIASPRYALTRVMVAGAPDDPGVYALWENEELIYYGHAAGGGETIQSRLKHHLAGAYDCTARATHYGWEIAANPPAREAELLREFERANKRLPRCNVARA